VTRIALSTWTFAMTPYDRAPEAFEGILDRAAELGYDGVEVGLFPPHPTVAELDTRAARDAYRDSIESRGLGIAGVVANFEGCPSILTNADNSAFLASLDEQLDLCAEIGTDMLRLEITDPPDVMRGVEYDLAYTRLIETWTEAGRHGEARGVRVGWEFEPGTPFNAPSEIVRIAEDVDHPWFGIIYDTTQAHNCALGRGQIADPPEALDGGQLALLEALAGRITHVHLIDSDGTLAEGRFSNHIPFGQGDVDWDAVIPALLAAGSRDDWWTVDVCFRPNAWPVFEEGLPFLDALRERFAMNGRNS
jgi:sugar phosphate isomerase/epimerase